MKQSDFDAFLAMWEGLAERYSKTMNQTFVAIDFKALAHLTLAEVRMGLQAHMQHPADCRFFPMPGQIIGHVAAVISDDGRLGVEEAWALARSVDDEFASVVWTQEIAEAWGVARHIMPDKVGARMAFKEAYERNVAEARVKRTPVQWTLCAGFDPEGRARALKLAAAQGRHVHGAEAVLALAGPRDPVALLEGPMGTDPWPVSTAGRAVLDRARETLAARMRKRSSADADARHRTEELRQQVLARSAAYAASCGIDIALPPLVPNPPKETFTK